MAEPRKKHFIDRCCLGYTSFINTSTKPHTLEIDAPASVGLRVRGELRKLQADVIGIDSGGNLTPQNKRSISYKPFFLDQKQIGALINFIGRNKFEDGKVNDRKASLIEDINRKVGNALGDCEEFYEMEMNDLKVDGKKDGEITIDLVGASQQYAPMIIAFINSEIVKHLHSNISINPIRCREAPSFPPSFGLDQAQSARLYALSVSTPPGYHRRGHKRK